MRSPNKRILAAIMKSAARGETHPAALPQGTVPGGLPPVAQPMNRVAPIQSPPTHVAGDFAHNPEFPRPVPR